MDKLNILGAQGVTKLLKIKVGGPNKTPKILNLPSYAVKIERFQNRYHKRIASLLNSKAANQVQSGQLNGHTKHPWISRGYKTTKNQGWRSG